MEAQGTESEQSGSVVSQKLPGLKNEIKESREIQIHQKQALDPISLEPVEEGRGVTLNKTIYDIVSLVHYFMSTTEFRDPLTGEFLTEDQIISLDMRSFSFMMLLQDNKGGAEKELSTGAEKETETKMKTSSCFSFSSTADEEGISSPSPPQPAGPSQTIDIVLPPLLPMYRKISAAGGIDKKRHTATLQSLDAIMGEMVSEIFDILVLDSTAKQDDFNFNILRLVSELDLPFAELKGLDPAFAYLSLQSYKSFLRGSKERPTMDPNRRLGYIISLLDRTLLTDADHARHRQDRRERSQSYDCQLPASSPRTRAESA